MDIDVIPLFSIPLFKTNLNRSDEDILNFNEKQQFKFLEVEKNGHMSKNVYVLESEELCRLKNDIQNNINFFVYEVLGISDKIQFYITNSWIMKHQINHWAQEHYHNNSLLTGIYYFDVTKETGEIDFIKNQA
jgi:hypothetical protein